MIKKVKNPPRWMIRSKEKDYRYFEEIGVRMKVKIQGIVLMVLFTALTSMVFPSSIWAESSQFEVIIRVNEEGFFDVSGEQFNDPIEVPGGQRVKLVFEHVGKPGEKHAFVLLFDSDEEIESGTITGLNRRTHIEFKSGEAGETYDVFCVIVDCDGMEHLTDLIIMAV